MEKVLTRTRTTADPGRQDFVTKSFFDAPRERVFKAFTDPDLIPQWWGPARLRTTVDKLEARTGGTWRFIHEDEKGEQFAFRGVFHEVLAPERLVYTFEWEGMPGHISLETVTLKDIDGQTEVTDQVVFQSVEDRDGAFQSGMEEGARKSMERLARLVEGEAYRGS